MNELGRYSIVTVLIMRTSPEVAESAKALNSMTAINSAVAVSGYVIEKRIFRTNLFVYTFMNPIKKTAKSS